MLLLVHRSNRKVLTDADGASQLGFATINPIELGA